MGNTSRRDFFSGVAWFTACSAFSSLLAEPSYAGSAEDVLRNASLILAKACLKPNDYKDFVQWQTACGVTRNPGSQSGGSFHDRFSFPVLFEQDFEMRRTRDRGGYFGVKGLPQTNSASHFAPDADLNAAEILIISETFVKDNALAVAVSSRYTLKEKDRDHFFFALGRKTTTLRPSDVDEIYYAREVRFVSSSQPSLGYGYSLAGQRGVGHFLLA